MILFCCVAETAVYDVLFVSSGLRHLGADGKDNGMLFISATLAFCVFSGLGLFFCMITSAFL